MHRWVIRTIRILGILAVVSSCGDDKISSETHFVRRASVEDATTLVIGTLDKDAPLGVRLYKSTDSGDLEIVKYFDQDQEELLIDPPTEVIDAGDSHLLLGFANSTLLVRKRDGATFFLGNDTPRVDYTRQNRFLAAQTDATNSIYYVVRVPLGDAKDTSRTVGQLARIDIGRSDAPTREILTPRLHDVQHFAVLQGGSLVYQHRELAETSDGIAVVEEKRFILRKETGEAATLVDTDSVWPGAVEGLFAATYEEDHDAITILVELEDFGTIPEGAPTFVIPWQPGLPRLAFHGHNTPWVLLPFASGASIAIDVSGQRVSSGVVEMPVTGASPGGEIDNLPINRFSHVAKANGRYVYIAGSQDLGLGALIGIDIETHDVIEPVTPGVYDISRMEQSLDGRVIFEATKTEDGTKVIGEIIDDTVSFIDRRPFEGEIKALVQIR